MRTTSFSTSRNRISAYFVLAAVSLNFAAAQDVPSALTIDEKTNAVYSSDESGTVTMRQGRTQKWRVNLGLSPQDKVHSLVLGRNSELYAAGSRNQSGFLVKLGADGTVVASLPTTRPARALAIDPAGAMWLAGDSFLTRLDEQLRPVFNVDPQGSVTSLAIDRKGTVYAAIAAGNKAITGKLNASTQTWAWRTEMGEVAPRGIALDEEGFVYVTGDASAPALMVTHAAQDHLIGTGDAFVARLDSRGAIQWSTYLGGSGTDSASSIVVTTDGMVVIGGSTTSADFPGAEATWSGTARGFLARLNSAGAIVRSDYLARPVTAPIGISRRINRGDTAAGVMTAALQSPISLIGDPCNITVTNTNDSGAGSLRQAIADASGCATTSNITFGVTGTITLASRILINRSLSIQGPGQTNLIISGNNATRIFFVGTGTTAPFSGTVSISRLTLVNGLGKGGSARSGGGPAPGMGGAIFQNGGTLNLSAVVLANNSSVGGNNHSGGKGGAGFGGDSSRDGADGGDLGGQGGNGGFSQELNGQDASGDGAGGGSGSDPALTGPQAGDGGKGAFGGGGGVGGSALNEAFSGKGGDGGFGAGAGAADDFDQIGKSGFGAVITSGAGFGGAIFVRAGQFSATNTVFQDNSAVVANSLGASAKGGALFIYKDAQASGTTLHFSANVAAGAGLDYNPPFPFFDYNGVAGGPQRQCPGTDSEDICGSFVPTLSLHDTATVSAGDNQSALNTETFTTPLKIRVPMTGFPVAFVVKPNGARGVFPGNTPVAVVTPDASGFATAPALTAVGPAGNFTVVAAGAVFHLTALTAVITPRPGTTPQTLPVATAVELSVTVTDNLGNAVVGRSVTFTAPTSGAAATFSNNSNTISVMTTSGGVASVSLLSNTMVGPYTVSVSTLGTTTNLSLTNRAGEPTNFTANPGTTPQSANISTAFSPLAVTVKDLYGNPVIGQSVIFSAPPSGASGTFSNGTTSISVPTDSSGVATATFTANAIGGNYQVAAMASPLQTSFSLTNSTPPVITNNPSDQMVSSGTLVTFTAGANGFPAPSVKWQVSAGGGAFADITGATSATLSFTTDGTQSGNTYRAVFTNSAGSATSTAATLTVTKVNPTITWTNPADIGFGTPLGVAQLNASASVAGTFAYTPPAGTVLNAGNGQTLSMLFTPTDSANYNTATATVRINVLPRQSVTVMAAASGQYSDVVTLSASVSQIVGAGSLQFQVAGGIVGPAVPVSGAGTYSASYTIANAAGTYPISAIFIPATTNILGSSATNTLTVGKEDATITPAANNRQTIQVNAPGGVAGPITFTGAVAETADGSSGDINKAAVTVTLVPAVAGKPNIDCPVTNNNGSLTATCSNVPVNAYTIRWSFNGNYYQGTAVNTVLAIFDPSLGFVTGSGTVLNSGVPGDFALSVKYQKNGALQGGLTYVEHRTGGDVAVSTTSLSSMSIVDNTAVIIGQATVNGVAGYSLQLTVTDNGEPGVNHDTFGLQLSGGTLTPPISFGPTTIVAGNLQTH